MAAPTDPQRRAQWEAERRRVARRHHPDLGGDTASYLAALAEVDRRFGAMDPGVELHTDLWTRVRRDLTRRRRGTRARVRKLRQRLPRGVPGSRRYFEL